MGIVSLTQINKSQYHKEIGLQGDYQNMEYSPCQTCNNLQDKQHNITDTGGTGHTP